MNHLSEELKRLHASNQPDTTFADQLEAELLVLLPQSYQSATLHPTATKFPRLYHRLTALVASLVILIGLFITVPPLRSFAEEVVGYFIPGIMHLEDSTPTYIEVTSIDEAEAMVGFDVLEWTAEDWVLRPIRVSKTGTGVGLIYDKHPAYILTLTQYIAGADDQVHTPLVSPSAFVETVSVNGVEGEFVNGGWVAEEDQDYDWKDWVRQLRWQRDNIVYHLVVSTAIAESVEDVITIAEALH